MESDQDKVGSQQSKELEGSSPALTPSYASPEQLLGTEIDHRSDIYSLGATAYTLLTGTPPFVARSFSDLVRMHVKTPPEPLKTRKPGIDPLVEKAVLKCLEKKPVNRFQTMEQLAGVLRKIRDHGDESEDSSWEGRLHDLLERIILADSLKESAEVLSELIALIRLHKKSTIPNRMERIRVMIADPTIFDVLIEKNLHRQNRGLLFQLVRQLESSTIAFVLLQRFQLERESWKKEFLAKLAVLSSRKNLAPLVLYSHEFSNSDAAVMIRASAIVESYLNEDILMEWARRSDRQRQMAVLDVCAKIATQSEDAGEILQLLASGVGTTHGEVQSRAAQLVQETEKHRLNKLLYSDI